MSKRPLIPLKSYIPQIPMRCGRAMGYKSHVTKASSASMKSVKTTIPLKVAEALEIRPGDVLDWVIEERNGRKIALVRKLE